MDLKKLGGGIIGVVLLIGLGVGFKAMGKANAAKDVKAKLMAICADEQDCKGAVNAHFDACFDKHYSMGGRRQSSRLNGEEFTRCMNQKAGTDYFAYEEK
jgi:hypothetical protein